MAITNTFSLSQPERDPRGTEGLSNIGAMRRVDLWRLADKMGVPYPSGATKEQMESILNAIPHMMEAVNSAVETVQQGPQGMATPLVDQIASQLKRLDKEESQEDIEERVLKASPMHKVRSEAKDRGIDFDKKTSKADLLDKMNVK